MLPVTRMPARSPRQRAIFKFSCGGSAASSRTSGLATPQRPPVPAQRSRSGSPATIFSAGGGTHQSNHQIGLWPWDHLVCAFSVPSQRQPPGPRTSSWHIQLTSRPAWSAPALLESIADCRCWDAVLLPRRSGASVRGRILRAVSTPHRRFALEQLALVAPAYRHFVATDQRTIGAGTGSAGESGR